MAALVHQARMVKRGHGCRSSVRDRGPSIGERNGAELGSDARRGGRTLALVLALNVLALAGCEDRVPQPLDGRGVVLRVHEGRLQGDFSVVTSFDEPLSSASVILAPGRLVIEVTADDASRSWYAAHVLDLRASGTTLPAWFLPGYRARPNLHRAIGGGGTPRVPDAGGFEPSNDAGFTPSDSGAGGRDGDGGIELLRDGGSLRTASIEGAVFFSAFSRPEERRWDGELPEQLDLSVEEGPRAGTMRIAWVGAMSGGRVARGWVVVDQPSGQYLVGWPAP